MPVVHETGRPSWGSVATLSGWLTAFCWWDSEGKRVQNYTDRELVFIKGWWDNNRD
jgi:hypothetical protein